MYIDLKKTYKLIEDLRKMFYPEFFEEKISIEQIRKELVEILLSVNSDLSISDKFIRELEKVKVLLEEDINAALNSDPASNDKDEVVLAYPGFYAIFVYRIANILYKEKVRLIPRIMSEYAHSKTGIDIHAGATIGKRFFIDHGTGVVIGETTIIGDDVKIYQGVTLGAMSLQRGRELKGVKRHPTIKNNVTIYSGVSIFGGNTVIGNNVTIGGNVTITSSIEDNTKVILESHKLIKILNESGE